MRRIITLSVAVVVLSPLSVPASAAPCPFPMVRVCQEPPQNRPPAAPMACKCVHPPGQTSGSGGGKAEIYKKNVPTVKPNKSPND